MGHKSPKGAVSITDYNGRIRLRWRHQGTRYSMSLLAFTKANLLQARKLALKIEQDILLEVFDVSLRSYHPNAKVTEASHEKLY